MLIVLAFAVMVVSSSFIMGRTLNEKLLQNANDVMDMTQSYISHMISEPEASLIYITDRINIMLQNGEDLEAVRNFMRLCVTTEYKEEMLLFEFRSLYAYFDQYDEFIHAADLIVADDFVATERPWYKVAEKGGGRVAMTAPYVGAVTGVPIIGYAQRIYDEKGEPVGTVVIDVTMEFISELLNENRITEGSYVFLIDETFHTIIHPDETRVGEYIPESNRGIALFSDEIVLGLDISLYRLYNYEGQDYVIFGRLIDNGWYLSMGVPESEYNQDLYQMIWFVGG
jgi:hypothetical protein